MKFLLLLLIAAFLFACGNKSADTGTPFCDTTCNSDTLKFTSDQKFNPRVIVSLKNCRADSITWTHDAMPANRQIHAGTFLNSLVRINRSALSCYIKDTSYVWLTFNDCITGRGYFLQLPFDKNQTMRRKSSAINNFDKKFVVANDLRAYTDYSSINVIDINTNKEAMMTYKEEYKMDFDKIHEVIDSVNISHDRIFVQLIKDGQKVPLEKKISL